MFLIWKPVLAFNPSNAELGRTGPEHVFQATDPRPGTAGFCLVPPSRDDTVLPACASASGGGTKAVALDAFGAKPHCASRAVLGVLNQPRSRSAEHERPRASGSHGLVQQWDGRSGVHATGSRAPPWLLPVGRAMRWDGGHGGRPGPGDPSCGAAASQGGTSETSYLAAICILMVPPAVLPDCFAGRKGNRKIYNPLKKNGEKGSDVHGGSDTRAILVKPRAGNLFTKQVFFVLGLEGRVGFISSSKAKDARSMIWCKLPEKCSDCFREK